MPEWLKDLLEDLRENWRDSYWWTDHPELRAAIVAIITGLIGLIFLQVELALRARYRLPRTEDV